jgi:hypothetical protein
MNDSTTARDLIGGLFLVPALHIAFGIIWLGIAVVLMITGPFFNQGYNFILLGMPYFFLGITQIAYVLPAHGYFAQKQRPEVCKGLIVSAIITLLVNGACFMSMAGSNPVRREDLLFLLLGLLVALAIGGLARALIRRRMR